MGFLWLGIIIGSIVWVPAGYLIARSIWRPMPQTSLPSIDEWRALGSAQLRPAAPEEHVLVPREPTTAMIEAHIGECAGDADEAGPDRIRDCWHAMLAAASAQGGGEG